MCAEVSALRKAAASAVAEFNGPIGPSLQLTEPDTSHEVTPSRAGSHQSSAPAKKESSRQASIDINATDRSNSQAASLHDGHADGSELRQSFDGVFTQRGCPPHGAKAICGRRPRMEDAYTAVPFLLEVITVLRSPRVISAT